MRYSKSCNLCSLLLIDNILGPTAIMSLMIQTHISGNPDYAVLTCFLSGCVIFVLGILNLGVLVRFISVPVTTGFTLAASVTIASGQINNLFGIKSKSDFVYNVKDSYKEFINIQRP